MELKTNPRIKKSWLLDLTILLVRFSVFFFLINNIFARESFEFNLGQKINVLSDKAFRKTRENEFEAVGNVVITHLKNSIYGEKAKLNFNTGETLVEGNVRYVSPNVTLYGTKLEYNFISKEIHLTNARVLSESFSVVGKNIYQKTATEILAEEAEYTTCKDCPESWSIYGKKIHITIGKYVTIKHAFIKMNGVIGMYIPYIVFPIKQDRESGLLFPSFSYKADEGIRLQQPYYWAINDYSDLTLAPSLFGTRGYGGEFQFRQNFKEKTWLQINTLDLNDQIYEPYKLTKEVTGSKKYRNFSDLEFHGIYQQKLNSHIYYNFASDLDIKRDFTYYTNDRVKGTEFGGGGFIDFRANSLFNLTFESYVNKNLLVSNPYIFDNNYVQILPKISLSSVPYNIIHTSYPFLKNVSIGSDLDFTIFKQNHLGDSTFIRNADRFNFNPYFEWQMGNLGPVFFAHTLKWDYQNYHFPYEKQNSFSKSGFVYETEAKFELERIFGISYIEEIPIKANEVKEKKDSKMLGELPIDLLKSEKQFDTNSIKSYRHSQEYKLKHYYLADQHYSGNPNFYTQIQKDSGQFDYIDALKMKGNSSSIATAQDSLPVNNTLELQWNNRLIRKSSRKFDPFIDGKYLRDNFEYQNVAYLDISQGVDLNIVTDRFSDKLTRLYLNTGLNFDNLSFSLQEFYFHRTGEHKASSEGTIVSNKSKFGLRFSYNSFNSGIIPVSKLLGGTMELFINDLLSAKNSADYNLKSKSFSQSFYSLIYSPRNNCWKLELNYSKDLIEKKVGFIFYINYNENNFASINVH
jgi:LPS-assembly protein